MTHDPNKSSGDIAPAEFREAGKRAITWIDDYLRDIRDYSVLPDCDEGDLERWLPLDMPEEGEALEQVENDFREHIIPVVTHWNHPRFFAYFSITGSMPGILGDLYATALNTNGMKWITCPASAELEKTTLRWLSRALGLPDTFHGILSDLASSSTLISLAAARERATNYETRRHGMAGRRLVFYTSEQAHVSVDKAAIVLGIGLDGVRRIGTDGQFRMDTGELRSRIAADRAAGFEPFAVVATAGTTGCTSVDPIAAVADIAAEEELWLHVDAAYAGPAALLPEKRPLFHGWELADSIVVNPHKWLYVPIDASALWFRDPEAFRHTFSIVPEYLTTADSADDPMDLGFQLGRRFRSLKLWFVMRAFGRAGLERRIRAQIEMASEFRAMISRDENWEVFAPVHFSTVCFRWTGGGDDTGLDEINAAILRRVNAAGAVYLSHTELGGCLTLRLTIGNIRTTIADVEAAWHALRKAAAAVS